MANLIQSFTKKGKVYFEVTRGNKKQLLLMPSGDEVIELQGEDNYSDAKEYFFR